MTAAQNPAYAAAIARAAAKMNHARIELAIQQVEAIDKAGIGLADQCAANLFAGLMRCQVDKQAPLAAKWLEQAKDDACDVAELMEGGADLEDKLDALLAIGDRH